MCSLDSRRLLGPLRSRREQPALHAAPDGANASITDRIFPGLCVFPEHCFSLSFFPVALVILGSYLRSHISFWEEVSEKGC